MSYLQTALEAGGLCVFCGIPNHFPPAVLGCTSCLNPCLYNGSGLDVPSSPCLSVPGLCRGNLGREEGRELQISSASVLIGLAGLSIPCVIILPCTALLVPDQHSSTLQEQTKTPTEIRGKKIQPLLLANFCVSCWQVF